MARFQPNTCRCWFTFSPDPAYDGQWIPGRITHVAPCPAHAPLEAALAIRDACQRENQQKNLAIEVIIAHPNARVKTASDVFWTIDPVTRRVRIADVGIPAQVKADIQARFDNVDLD